MFEHIDPTIREWLFAREVMRRIGFAPDEIFFAVHPVGKMIENGVHVNYNKPTIVLRVEAQGLEFNWTIGPTEVPNEQLESCFERACDDWNNGCNGPEIDQAFKSSKPFRQAIPVMQAMVTKGFVIRKWN